MRNSTRLMSTLVATSSLVIAWNMGNQASSGDLIMLPAPVADGSSNDAPLEPSNTPVPDNTVPDTTAPDSTVPETTVPDSPVAEPATSQAPAVADPVAVQPVETPVATVPVLRTITSDVITYKYGEVQISADFTDGLITNINLIRGDASNGRASAYERLTQATIQVQGTDYGNISGATFTVDAFKKAVDSLLAKR